MSRRTDSPSRRRGGTLAGSLGLLLSAALLPAAPALGVEGSPLPVGEWDTCADDAAQYCIEQLTVDPLGDEPQVTSELTVSATTVPDDSVTSFDWSVDGWDGQSEAVRGGDVTLVIRTGLFVPRFTSAAAEGLHVSREVDDDGNHTMTVTGHPVHVDWTTGPNAATCHGLQYCGEYDDQADEDGTGLRFEGNTMDTGEGDAAMDGAYVANGAQARTGALSYNLEPEPSLSFGVIGNPALDLNGEPVRGSFNAFVPGGYFTEIGTTPEEAVETGFDLISAGDGMSASVPVTATVQDDGVAFGVTDIAYPAAINMLEVLHRASGATEGDGAPGAPAQVIASHVDDSEFGTGVIVEWAAPESDGGAPIAGYRARAYSAETGGTMLNRCDAEADSTSCTIYGLDWGTTVYVAPSAYSGLGEGLASERVAVTIGESATAPSTPLSVKAAPGPGRLAVSWAAPESDGGAPITGYTAKAYKSASGGTAVGSCYAADPKLNCLITGLTGVKHYVEVIAANEVGSSEPTAVRVGATPWTVAGIARSITAKSAKSKITIGWAAPVTTGGTAVTKYEARLYGAAKGGTAALKCTATGSVRSCVTTTLKPGRVYFVAVVAVNAVGSSVEPTRIKVTVKR